MPDTAVMDTADQALESLFAPTILDSNPLRRNGVAKGSFSVEVSNVVYHADRSAYSCSSLKPMLRSPAHFLAARNAPHEESSTSQNLGTAVHTAILEPHLFDSTVVSWDGRRAGKVYDEFKAANAGKIILTLEEMTSVKAMRNNVVDFVTQEGYRLGELIEKGESEKTIFWKDPRTGLMLKIRADNLLAPVCTWDLKTVGDARPDEFVRTQALKLGYDMQAAMYTCGVKEYTGETLPFGFITVETDLPHSVCVHYVRAGSQFFNNGLAKFNFATRRLKECLDANSWPSYENRTFELDTIPPYLLFDSGEPVAV